MKNITIYFLITMITASVGLATEIKSLNNACSGKIECDKSEQDRNALVHKLKGDLHALRWNIEDYGATPEIYDKLNAIDNEIEYICISCSECQLKKCHTHQHMLQRKSRHTKALADQHAQKKMRR